MFFYKIVNLFGLLSDQRSLGQLQNEKDGRSNAAWIKMLFLKSLFIN